MDSNDAFSLQSDSAYSAMVEEILAAIANGQLKLGQRIASETKLKEQYGISVTSIKRGLNVLVERGILRRRRGSGTFVAGTDVSLPQQLVRRDTIAIVRFWEQWRYHPFFSEQHAGILAGLAKHGWKAMDLQWGEKGAPPPNRERSYRHLTPSVVKLELGQHQEVAGAICVYADQQTVNTLAEAGHVVVATDCGENYAGIAYDWDAEVERLFRIALEKGARKLGVVGTLELERAEIACSRAAGALGLAREGIELEHLLCSKTGQTTGLITQAYQLTMKAFKNKPKIDGLVITDDFEAMGVTDALAQIPSAKWKGFPVVALLNKESKLQARVPMTALVADGYAYGMALAELIHEKLATGGSGISKMTMSCCKMEWR